MTTVTLDALGTLVELEPPAPLLVAGLKTLGAAVSAEQAGAALRGEIAYYREHHDSAVDARSLAALRDRCTVVLRDALTGAGAGAEVAGVGHGELRLALLGALRFRAYPEVPAALAALRAAGHRLVVVSNWDVSLHEALERAGLRDLVDAAISSAEAGVAKPGAAIFARALELVGGVPHGACHVGDSVEHDVAGARAAGLRAVLVVREGEVPEGCDGVPVVRSLAELDPVGPYSGAR